MCKRPLVIVLALLFAFVTACAAGEPPQTRADGDGGTVNDEDTGGGNVDVGQPDAHQPDVGQDTGPSFEPPQFYHSTSGGGLSTSPTFRLQMNFGAPMPRGTSSNDEYRLRFGPVSP